MPTVGEELMSRPGGNLQGLSRKFVVDVSGSSDPEEDVVAWVLSNAPASIAGLVLRDVSLQEFPELEDHWEATAQYGTIQLLQPPPESGAMEYRFNFQAQGAHIYQSLATMLYSTAEGSDSDPSTVHARDFKGAINVVNDSGKLRCEGLQLEPPSETFTLAYYPVNAVVSSGYQQIVEDLCGKVNSGTFRSKAGGSVMLVRANGGVRTGDDWSLEFGFGYVPNATDIPVGDEITVASKDGLDLLWPFYGEKVDEDAKALIKQPVAAYVERVWPRGDFSALSLPS